MANPFLVRRFERLEHLPGDAHRFVDGERSASEPPGQRLAFNEFQHQKPGAA